MTGDFGRYQSTRRFSCLDGLRFLCIAAVVWHHSPLSVQYMQAWPIAGRGFLGVDFFFVLSGYLITTLLLREEQANGRFSLTGFYWRRILRIVPVYFFVVTMVGLYYVVVKGAPQMAGLWPYYYLFLADFLKDHIPLLSPTWSLAVEEQYYMIWPIMLMLLPRRAVVPVLLGLIVLNVVIATGLFGTPSFETKYLLVKLPTATFAPILIGSLLAISLHHRGGFNVVFALVGRRLAPLASFAALILIVAFAPPDISGLPNLAIHLIMAACLAALVVRDDNILSRPFSTRWISRIGQISYGLYLYHLIALFVAKLILSRLGIESGWTILGLYSLISLLMAEISFRTLERYFLALRHPT